MPQEIVKMKQKEFNKKTTLALLAQMPGFISIYNEKRQLVYETPSVNQILGYTDEKVVYGLDEDFMTPKGYKEFLETFDYLLANPGSKRTMSYAYLNNTGEKIYLETTGRNLLDDKDINAIVFNTHEITHHIKTEHKLRRELRVQMMMENSDDMIMRADMNGKITYANTAALQFIGNSLEIETLNGDSNIIGFINESFTECRQKHASKKDSNDPEIRSVIEIEMEKGRVKVEATACPEFDTESGELECVLFIVRKQN